MRKKRDLPTKTCQTCGRPFTWRRKNDVHMPVRTARAGTSRRSRNDADLTTGEGLTLPPNG